jgi:acetylornithine aminotransferase/acetylornithine/N-succinyldiaminopimelate aminotransferase
MNPSASVSPADTAALYDAYVMKNYGRPSVNLVRGEGTYVWDDAGRRYLDFTTGIAVNALGHCHPRWVAAVQAQAARANSRNVSSATPAPAAFFSVTAAPSPTKP